MNGWFRDPIWQFIAVIIDLAFRLIALLTSRHVKRKKPPVRSWLNRLFGKQAHRNASKRKYRGRPKGF